MSIIISPMAPGGSMAAMKLWLGNSSAADGPGTRPRMAVDGRSLGVFSFAYVKHHQLE